MTPALGPEIAAMTDPHDIRDASRDVLALLGRVAHVQPRIADETLRRFVSQLSGRLREVQSQLRDKVPAHVAESRSRLVSARQKAEDIKSRLPEIRRQEEANESARLAQPPTPEPQVDPNLPPTLRAELLERYGPRPTTPRGMPGGNPQRPGWGH